MSTTRTCISSLNPPFCDANCEVSGRGATLIHLTPGRYSRSAYSFLTDVIENAVEFVSWILSAAAKATVPLSLAIYKRLSIPFVAISQVFDP
ncbi:MAG: hypothetical protein CM15mV10_0620 [uncultured marine virus]|nr:MAG: hypothetical protein CM15mV10_0620 [uncultured marine virus]